MLKRTFFTLLTQLSSRKWISESVGYIAKSNTSKCWIPSFAKIYQIPIEEAERPISEYPSLNAFFTRRLKPGMRPIDLAEHVVTSPVDAEITAFGKIEQGLMLEIKGPTYTVAQLLNGSKREEKYKHGQFFVLYLSPKDYHRIHVPAAGKILEKQVMPGRVFPVNHAAMTNVKQVLSRNYRIATYLQHAKGEIAIVKVAALNVASIQFVEGLQTEVQKGDELAYFEFGSTVVLLLEQATFKARADLQVGSRVRMGESLGEWI